MERENLSLHPTQQLLDPHAFDTWAVPLFCFLKVATPGNSGNGCRTSQQVTNDHSFITEKLVSLFHIRRHSLLSVEQSYMHGRQI